MITESSIALPKQILCIVYDIHYSAITVKKIAKVHGFFLFSVLFSAKGGKSFMLTLIHFRFLIKTFYNLL